MSTEMKTRFTDVFDKCDSEEGYFGRQRKAGDRYLTRPTLEPRAAARMDFQGTSMIMWSVNNYLGLADNEEIKKYAVQAVEEFGVSSPMGSRMMTGTTEYHLELERALADYAQKEAAFLFNYGYMGVIGTVASLAGPDDVVVMDKLAHACIVDAAFMAPAQVRVFRHNDMNSLEAVLKRTNRDRKGGVLILTEGVYGMTGDLANIPEICALKEQYDARLFIDDAHGWGVMGENGRGIGEYFGLQDKVDVYFGTFAKAFASIGGFSASTQAVVDWIGYNARTQVFAKSLPMVYVRSLRKTLDFVREGGDLRARMWQNSAALKTGLRDLGYYVGDGESPICAVFVPIGEDSVDSVGLQTVKYLRDRGVFVTAVAYPVIPPGLLMFRMIPTAAHGEAEITETVAVFKSMRDELGITLDMTGDDLRKVNKVYGRAAK